MWCAPEWNVLWRAEQRLGGRDGRIRSLVSFAGDSSAGLHEPLGKENSSPAQRQGPVAHSWGPARRAGQGRRLSLGGGGQGRRDSSASKQGWAVPGPRSPSKPLLCSQQRRTVFDALWKPKRKLLALDESDAVASWVGAPFTWGKDVATLMPGQSHA